MRVKDIFEEIREVTGSCDESVNFRAITRGIQLLANEGLVDPLLGTIDFTVDGGYLIALPRDVKTPIRININNNPSFARNRLFEFTQNTPGSVDGPEVGFQWHDRGYSPIQDERKLPSKLSYVTAEADEGSSLTVSGVDVEGRFRTESIIGAATNPTPTQYTYGEVRIVTRTPTTQEAYLHAETGAIARYYADEEQPEYRVIKLSQTGVAVRMLYRKHVFKITSQEDIIPLNSEMAVIRATRAARLYQQNKDEEAEAVFAMAVRILTKEQESRDENNTVSGALEIQTAINSNITTNGVLIVADVYDMASDILGPIGRAKIYDRLTDAINALSNKSQWDSLIGEVVLTRMANMQTPRETTVERRRNQTGHFTLPRYVGSVLAVNTCGIPATPKNQWFEFHVNTTGERNYARGATWQDVGETVVINQFRRMDCNKIIAAPLCAVCENGLDVDKLITIYGIERTADGREIEVWRNGTPGWNCPCKSTATLALDAPEFVRVDRITRAETVGFVTLYALNVVSPRIPEVIGVPEQIIDTTFAISFASGLPGYSEPGEILAGTLGFSQDGAESNATYYIRFITDDGGGFNWRVFIVTSDGSLDLVDSGDAGGVIDNIDDTFTFHTIIGDITAPDTIRTADFGTFTYIKIVGTEGYVIPEIPYSPEVPAVIENDVLLGYWYPDEIEPRYRTIKVACISSRLTVKYRKRTNKISSLYDVINLRSRLALENMLRALATQSTDPVMALNYEQIAVKYLEEEQRASNPIPGGAMQFDPGLSPGVNFNIQ